MTGRICFSLPSPKKKTTTQAAKRDYRDLLICLFLLAAIFAVYSQVRHFDFVNYDDPDYVSNAHVRNGLTTQNLTWAFASVDDANWFPLTRISHLLDLQLFGFNSGPQHLTNVLLHAISAVLLFWLFQRMTGARWPSAFVAFVFALHPLHVESVAWVAERKDVLSTLFLFLALWAYLNYVKRPAIGRYLLVVLWFCAGIMSKPMVVTLPFMALLLDVWPLRRFSRRAILEKLPLLAISAAASIVTYLAQQEAGSVASFNEIPFALRAGNTLVTYVTYISQFFWPVNLAVFYPYPAGSSLWPPTAAALLLAGITVLALRSFKRRPYLAVGWFWYLCTLVPVIGLIQVGLQSRADRYTYVPLIGLSIMLAWGFADLYTLRPAAKSAVAVLGVLACSVWSYLTWLNLANWRDSVSLFQHASQVTSENYVAYNNLGAALQERGQTTEAVADIQEALRIRPQYPDAQNNLGDALLAQGKTDEAAPHIQEALRLDPGLPEAHINWATVLNKRGQHAEGAAEYRVALQLEPDNAQAHCGLGVALLDLDRYPEALTQLVEAIALKSDYADAHYNLGILYGALKRTDEAIGEFSATIRLQPNNPEAHFNLGTAFAAEDRLSQAIPEFQAAVRLNPNYINARFNLGSALASLGRYDEAITEFSEVLRLKPDFTAARRSLEACFALARKAQAKPPAPPR
jgi:tetratricopeptide (TPR) repeat protein